jgi:nitroimidazol reductase NimA-like FMN-containing flavoprotein (pyridoxamine 5'-phosphate oxidase superfamily)
MMDTQELTQELGQPGAQELLRSAGLLRLAYNGTDGLPRVIPLGFFWTGDSIVVCTATTSPKARGLAQHPEVAITIDTGATPAAAKSLQLRGVAELETVDGIPKEYLAAAQKSQDDLDVVEFEQAVRAMYKQMVRISVQPTWARFYDFGAGRFPEFLTKLASEA